MTPLRRASANIISGSSEPSMCRCSSAFGRPAMKSLCGKSVISAPVTRFLLQGDGIAAVDRQGRAGDEVGGGRGEEDGDAGEVVGPAPAPGRRARQNLVVQALDLLAGAQRQLGVDPAGQDAVHLDVVGGPGGGE